jgi:hypothetical protein
MVERREQAVGHDVLGGGPVTDDEVGHRLQVPAVPVEQVGQLLGASPTQCLDRHPSLRVTRRPDPPESGLTW